MTMTCRISNEKPSAIFRLRGTFNQPSSSTSHTAFSSTSPTQPTTTTTNDVTAVLGLSIEPLPQIQAQLATLPTTMARAGGEGNGVGKDPTLLAERIVKHLFNYVAGFVGGGVSPELAVPMNVIVKWYESFMGKVRAGGVGFLERED
ncbi:inositol metabolism protein Opi10 [Lyophyllum atratum]|nr:inositol metabolism protein Opi10 [Lyophyllum atratum]